MATKQTNSKPKSDAIEYVALDSFKPRTDEPENTIPAPLSQTINSGADDPGRHRSGRRWWWRIAVLAIASAVLIESYLLIQQSFATHWLLGALWSVGLGLVVVLLLSFSAREFWQLRRLKRQWNLQQQLQHQPEKFTAEPLLQQLNRSDLTLLWQQQLQPHWSSKEQLQRFEEDILSCADQQVNRVISKYSVDAAVLVALSPSAMLDMLLMLWRNQRMVTKIAAAYGIKLGYWSRIKLWRQLLANIAYAGASEAISDLGASMLGAELAGKLSLRAGQGLGAGLLTARLGLQAQRLCRPLQFTHVKRPGLANIQADLLKQLAQRVPLRAGSSTKADLSNPTKVEK